MAGPDLGGKVIVVTGAGNGLGRAYAHDLALAGASVVVNDVDGDAAHLVAEEITASGGVAFADVHSVADRGEAAQIIDATVARSGRLDGLVNNAGVFYLATPEDDDPGDAADMVAVNLLGTLYCGLRAIRHMVGHGGGVIVNDTSGAQAGMSRRGAYGATKGATASLTYSWAADLARHGIRVNAISPIARTAMSDYGLARGEAGATWAPGHVAPLVTYLMDDASIGVTGQVIRLDGHQLSVLSRPGSQRWTAEAQRWDHTTIASTLPGLIAAPG